VTATVQKLSAPDFTRDLDASREELLTLLDLAAEVKHNPGQFAQSLAGQSVALLFEKPSLRTRFTFELGVQQMGGSVVTIDGPIAVREPVKDIARNLERWVNAIVARTFAQDTVDQLAAFAKCPVINALSDLYHPCQALADFQTLREHFGHSHGPDLRGLKLTFVGDGNNVAHSLMLNAARLGVHFALATPVGYEPDAAILQQARTLAKESSSDIIVTHNPRVAVSGAHAVYTDVWASMGQESEAPKRKKTFAPFQVTADLMKTARPEAVFMHCLPAKRGEETTEEVLESKQSIVFDQAENRLHAQKALMLMLLA
jgi:ornithine carbamoyltransferase